MDVEQEQMEKTEVKDKQAVGATPKVVTSLSIIEKELPMLRASRSWGWSKRSHNNILIVHSILLFNVINPHLCF